MNEEITKMSLLITHLDVSTETKEKLYTQNYKIATEIERLNNIIDELENWLKEETIGLYDEDNPLLLDASYTKYATERRMAYMYVLDKLKELKGSDKDEKNINE